MSDHIVVESRPTSNLLEKHSFSLTRTRHNLRKLEYHRTTTSVPLHEEKQILKMISDLEKKKRTLQEWEECDKQIRETKVREMKQHFLVVQENCTRQGLTLSLLGSCCRVT